MSETATPNIPYLRKVVEWVEAEAERTENREWYQATWMVDGKEAQTDFSEEINFCDTACCVAGKVALLEGWKPETYLMDPSSYTGNVVKGGYVVHASEVAKIALGLTQDQADDLFEATNTAEGIRLVAEEIAGERL